MIGQTETALLAAIRGMFGSTLRDVDTHPGTWSDIAIRRITSATPSVWVAWLGFGEGRTLREVETRWVLYVCADMLNGREGDRLGTYQIVERLIAGLNGFTFGPTTGFRVTKGQNLYTDTQAGAGVALYGLYFSGRTPLPAPTDETTLDDFERHWQTWQTPDGSPVYAAHINVNERTEHATDEN